VLRGAWLTEGHWRPTLARRWASRDHRVRPRNTRTVPRRRYGRRRTSADHQPKPTPDPRIALHRNCQRSSEHVPEFPSAGCAAARTDGIGRPQRMGPATRCPNRARPRPTWESLPRAGTRRPAHWPPTATVTPWVST